MVVPDRPQLKYSPAHAYLLLDTKGYKHTLRMCYAYCFTTATVVVGKRLDVTI